MKKFYLLSALGVSLFAGSVMAQSQRLVLAEEFTQASCGPCASQNPAFNTLLAANPTKVVSIKYQTSWPGVDPMNAQTQTLGVATRVTYYAVNGVPHATMDGTAQTGASYTGAPANWTQAKIDTRYATSSPFDVSVSHTYDATYSNMDVSVTVTCTQAVSGTLKLRVALVEEEINFCSAPGTNGETDFYGVMRKMLPDGIGTALSNSWTVGQSQTFSFSTAVPAHIYNGKQLAVVAFVQDDGNKEVKQTGISTPAPLANFAILKSCAGSSIPSISCSSPINGVNGTITNDGTSTLTSCDINYQVDGGTINTYNWTGSLAPGASATFALPAIAFSGNGSHDLDIWAATANGTANFQCLDTRMSASFNAYLSGTVPPIVEQFTVASFPPANWGVNDAANDNIGWTRVPQGLGGNNGSAKIDFYNNAQGNVDELIIPSVDLSGAVSAQLTFQICKAPYTGYSDNIKVNSSTNCGSSWNTLWTKSDPTLSTMPAQTTGFTPNASSVWRLETVDLVTLLGQSNVILAFQANSGYGNNAYIDDVNVTISTGIGENAVTTTMNVFPSITTGEVTLSLQNVNSADAKITITDVTGKLVNSFMASKNASNNILIDLSTYPDGLYLVQAEVAGQRLVKKVVLEK